MQDLIVQGRAGVWNKFLFGSLRKRRKETSCHKRPVAVAPQVLVSSHDEGLVLLHIPSGRIFQCNRTASRIWEGLSRGWNEDKIAEDISRAYGVPIETVHRDTQCFVAKLESNGFLTRCGSAR